MDERENDAATEGRHSLFSALRRRPLQVRRCLEEIRDLREQVKFLERQRDRALSDRVAWERACHDSDARLGALIKHAGWDVAEPILSRVDAELSRAR